MQHLRIGSKLHQFTTQVPSTSAPEPLINGVATDVTVTNITDAYYEVEFDFVPTGPTSPVLGVVQVIPWSAPFIVDQD